MKPEKIKPVSVSTTTTLGEFADTAKTPNDDCVILRWGTEPTAIVNSNLIYDVAETPCNTSTLQHFDECLDD